MKKKTLLGIFLISVVAFMMVPACKTEHKIEVETNKPIKIEARIDIYLHAESIEDMVSGKAPIPEVKDRESLLKRIIASFEREAFAEGVPIKEFTENIRQIVLRRKNRFSEINGLVASGKAKEGPKGYLEAQSNVSAEDKKLIDEENADRKSLYTELAKQNNLSLEEVEKAFAKVHQKK